MGSLLVFDENRFMPLNRVSYASVKDTRRLALDLMLVKLILMPVTIFFATTIALP